MKSPTRGEPLLGNPSDQELETELVLLHEATEATGVLTQPTLFVIVLLLTTPLPQCLTVDGAIRFSSISIIARGLLVGPLGEISARFAPRQ